MSEKEEDKETTTLTEEMIVTGSVQYEGLDPSLVELIPVVTKVHELTAKDSKDPFWNPKDVPEFQFPRSNPRERKPIPRRSPPPMQPLPPKRINTRGFKRGG